MPALRNRLAVPERELTFQSVPKDWLLGRLNPHSHVDVPQDFPRTNRGHNQ